MAAVAGLARISLRQEPQAQAETLRCDGASVNVAIAPQITVRQEFGVRALNSIAQGNTAALKCSAMRLYFRTGCAAEPGKN